MEKNKIYGLISIGILIGALFPQGLQNLLFKILERILFNTDLNVFAASGLSAIIGLVVTVLVFIRVMNYFMAFDYTQRSEIKKALVIGLLINVFSVLVWSLLPFMDSWLGSTYSENIIEGYYLLSKNTYMSEFWISGMSSFLCFISIVIIIFNKVNTVDGYTP